MDSLSLQGKNGLPGRYPRGTPFCMAEGAGKGGSAHRRHLSHVESRGIHGSFPPRLPYRDAPSVPISSPTRSAKRALDVGAGTPKSTALLGQTTTDDITTGHWAVFKATAVLRLSRVQYSMMLDLHRYKVLLKVRLVCVYRVSQFLCVLLRHNTGRPITSPGVDRNSSPPDTV